MPADVEGVPQLVSTLGDVVTETQTEGPKAAAKLLEGPARDSAPRRTGALAATVVAQVSEGLVAVTAGSQAVDYAAAVHAVNPWITRTVDQRTQQVVAAYTEVAQVALSQVKGT